MFFSSTCRCSITFAEFLTLTMISRHFIGRPFYGGEVPVAVSVTYAACATFFPLPATSWLIPLASIFTSAAGWFRAVHQATIRILSQFPSLPSVPGRRDLIGRARQLGGRENFLNDGIRPTAWACPWLIGTRRVLLQRGLRAVLEFLQVATLVLSWNYPSIGHGEQGKDENGPGRDW